MFMFPYDVESVGFQPCSRNGAKRSGFNRFAQRYTNNAPGLILSVENEPSVSSICLDRRAILVYDAGC